MQWLGESALVIDAKALYGAAQKEHVHNFKDRSTGIEVMVLKQRMKAAAVTWKWVNSERQFADGLTKPAARQLLADRLRVSRLCLQHDPNFVTAKKKDKEDRREASRADAASRPQQQKTKGNRKQNNNKTLRTRRSMMTRLAK
jgi:hypothetical protein